MRNALGLRYSEKPYRNYYVSGPTTGNFEMLNEMVEEGWLTCQPNENNVVFYVTNKGKNLFGVQHAGLD